MAKQDRQLLEGLTQLFRENSAVERDRLGELIGIAAAYNHMMIFLYSLLAASFVFLLFLWEFSPWAGAAVLASWGLFIVGLAHTAVHAFAFRKITVLSDFLAMDDETDDFDDEDGLSEESRHMELLTRELQTSNSRYLLLGMLLTGIALVIEHWEYAWRSLAILAGIVALLIAIAAISWATGLRADSEEVEDE